MNPSNLHQEGIGKKHDMTSAIYFIRTTLDGTSENESLTELWKWRHIFINYCKKADVHKQEDVRNEAGIQSNS